MKKTAAQDSNPGPLSRESEALPLSHCALCTNIYGLDTLAVTEAGEVTGGRIQLGQKNV